MVENPFDTTQKAGATDATTTAPSTTSGTTATAPSATKSADTGIISSNMAGGNSYTTAAPDANTVSQYNAVTRTVDPATQTVQGQVESILSKDSPLMQRARTLATQQMAQRGLVNSSMAVGAGTAAMIDKATPIAAQDANTYATAASENMAAKNQNLQFNLGEQNKFSLQGGQQKFTAAQSELDRAQQVNLQKAQQDFTAAQNEVDRAQQVYLQDRSFANQEALQKSQQNFTAAQSDLDRAQQIYMQDDVQAFQERMKNTEIPANFAMAISSNLAQSVNAIAADANLSGTVDGYYDKDGKFISTTTIPSGFVGSSPKTRAIQSTINYANAQVSWANKFYSTAIPQLPSQ